MLEAMKTIAKTTMMIFITSSSIYNFSWILDQINNENTKFISNDTFVQYRMVNLLTSEEQTYSGQNIHNLKDKT